MKTGKRLIAGLSATAIALSCMSFVSFADSATTLNSFEATKENVKILGRAKYMESADALWFGLTDAGVEFKFTGSTAVISLSADSAAASDSATARIAIYADGKLYRDTTTAIADRDYKVNFDASGEHTVRLMKLSECPNGTLRINEIKVDGEKIEPTAAAEKKIEFIGDSITCGYGVDGAEGSSFSTRTEDGTKTYAYRTAKKLNADYSMVSFSGYGIISGYSSNGQRSTAQCVPDYYGKLGNSWGSFSDGKLIQNESWDFSEYVPDLVVVNLGTNDASYISSIKNNTELQESERQAFTETYEKFIGQIREANPNAEILCTLGIMGQDLYPQVEAAVKNYKTNNPSDTKVNAFEFNVQDTAKNGVGSDWHPAPQSHVDAAYELLDEINKLYSWKADDSVYIDVPSLEPEIDKAVSITVGESKELSVKASPAAAEEITYTVSDKTIAAFDGSDTKTVTSDANGKASAKITGVKEGATSVAVTTADGRKTTFRVTVSAAPAEEKTSIKNATVKLSATKKTYTGKAIKPGVTVKVGKTTLKKGTDYTVAYKNNKNTGKATVTVTGKGSYTGSKTATFIIKPAKAAIKSAKSPKTKQIKVTWKKSAGGVTGYQVTTALDKKFSKSKKSYTVKKAATTSKTITKLKKGKTYYVKVRAYKTVGKTKYYGAYSAAKKVTVK